MSKSTLPDHSAGVKAEPPSILAMRRTLEASWAERDGRAKALTVTGGSG